jgi:hypothetical protein
MEIDGAAGPGRSSNKMRRAGFSATTRQGIKNTSSPAGNVGERARRRRARFSTVLGPGSDGNHEEHIHVDLAERHGGYKMCEWEVREPIKQAEQTVPQTEGPVAALTGPVPLPHPRPAMSIRIGYKKIRAPFR